MPDVALADVREVSAADGQWSPAALLGALELCFVPSDPPRDGCFVAYDPEAGAARGAGGAPGRLALDDEVEVVVLRGSSPRRRRVPARRIAIGDALVAVRDLEASSGADGCRPSGALWSRVVTAALGMIAEGRLFPSVSDGGHDAWQVGPYGPAHLRLVADLAASFPPAAHAVPLSGAATLRLPTPEWLVRACFDAVADSLVRTPAATVAAGSALYSAGAPQDASHLRTWLGDAALGLEGGASIALRIELGDEPRGVLQLTSRVESSLVVDAAELFVAPASVLSRFGEDAERDLLVTLRRGAKAWRPLEALLRDRVPSGIDLDEELLAELLEDGATLLQGTGIEVLWPSEMLGEGLVLRAAVVAAPGKVDEGGFSLESLLAFEWQATLDGSRLSPEEIDQLAEAKRGLVRLRGRFVAVDPALLERLLSARPQRLSAAEALGALLAGTVELGGEQVELVAQGAIAELARKLRELATGALADPGPIPGLRAELRPYQARGVAWLQQMTATGLGACLADDMGLGKTLQVIALHLLRRSAGALGATLVVCPTSLLGNWEREVRRFAPDLPVRRYHSTGRSLEGLAPDEIVVTSYGVARLDAELLDSAGFSLVVADEAQHAKNPASATARRLRAIGSPARLALTGTPVENRLSELWAILDWTTPGLLGPLERFVRTVAIPVERYRDPVMTERLGRIVRPFLLRRRKSDPEIAPDLPPRTVSDVPVPLTSEQTTLYEAEVREALAAIRDKEGFARQGLVLRLLTVLKQICNHPAQYLHQPGPLRGRSGKLDALEELLGVILAEGDSVLVFSQFVECHALLEARLAELGIPTLFLHGKTPPRQRMAMVDAFQAGEVRVFLLSIKAGGVGLNLTRATHVVHYDRWWNPAVEDQATDRAHRIGQDRPVQVHRLIAEGTLEDRIAELLEKKRSLAEAVVGGGEAWISQLDDEALAELVTLGSGS